MRQRAASAAWRHHAISAWQQHGAAAAIAHRNKAYAYGAAAAAAAAGYVGGGNINQAKAAGIRRHGCTWRRRLPL